MINVRIRNGLCPDPTTGEGGATEGDIRGSFSDIIEIVGVKDLVAGDCLVTQNSPTAMSVLVAPGVVYIPNILYNKLDSNTVKFWEAIVTVSTPVVITANTSGLTRIDLICAKMDIAIIPDEHASNISTLVAVAGTPGAGIPITPNNHYKLAEITVANGVSTIITANITDRRIQSKIDFDFLPKATGATINTGISDTTIVTPKAIADSYIGSNFSSLNYQAIINGNFVVNQRVYVSAATLAVGVYGHDRWKAGASGGDYSFTQLASSTQITIATGKSLIQVVEDKNVVGGAYTLSWTGTAQARYSINSATPAGTYASSPIAITGQTAGTVMSVEFNAGTLGKVNLNSGSVALPFMPKSFDEELRACKRYGEPLHFTAFSGTGFGTTAALVRASYSVEKRNTTQSTTLITAGVQYNWNDGGAGPTGTSSLDGEVYNTKGVYYQLGGWVGTGTSKGIVGNGVGNFVFINNEL